MVNSSGVIDRGTREHKRTPFSLRGILLSGPFVSRLKNRCLVISMNTFHVFVFDFF